MMSTKEEHNIKNAARDTVTQNNNIEKSIRNIVVQALKDGQLQPDEIKQTIKQVIEGACEGLGTPSANQGDALKQVVTGVDAALNQFAEVSQLAIKEASGNLQDFTDHDLKRALNDLEDLESLFLDTLSEAADKGKETTRETLRGLVNHLQNSGSSVGQSVKEILTDLHHDLSENGRLQKIQVADIAKATGATFARVSSGILAGIADSLDPKEK